MTAESTATKAAEAAARVAEAEAALANAEQCHFWQPSKWPYDYTAQRVAECRADLAAAKAAEQDAAKVASILQNLSIMSGPSGADLLGL